MVGKKVYFAYPGANNASLRAFGLSFETMEVSFKMKGKWKSNGIPKSLAVC